MQTGIDLLPWSITIWVILLRLLGIAASYPREALLAPCQFPSKYDAIQRHSLCSPAETSSYICDVDKLLEHHGIASIVESFEKYHGVLEIHNTTSIAIVIVKELAPPSAFEDLIPKGRYYDCLFDDECFRMYPDRIERLKVDSKYFVKVYASILYKRWFVVKPVCNQALVLALVIVDGLVNDEPRGPVVALYTGDFRLMPALENIQFEATNAIAQGTSLHDVIAELVSQLGHTLFEFYALGGKVRDYSVPRWACYAIAGSIAVAVSAMAFEWYVVRRKLSVKRMPANKQSNSCRSKALMLVDSMSSSRRDGFGGDRGSKFY